MHLLKRYHKLCHAYVHDNCSNTFPLNSYFEVSQMLYIIVISIYKDICNQIRIDSLINELDVLKELNKAYNKLVRQIENRSSELFEEYYNKQ